MVSAQNRLHVRDTRQFYPRKPTEDEINAFLQSQVGLPFSYTAVGATQTALQSTPPAGYVVDYNQGYLGHGAVVYQQACAALEHWEMFNLDWVRLCWPTTPITSGAIVGVMAQLGPIHILNCCRVVYTVNEKTTEGARFGFAYGTLPGHIERGEERFLIEWRHDDDTVWYDILAFSQPKHWLVQLGYPVTRAFQKRFARDSKATMRRITNAT